MAFIANMKGEYPLHIAIHNQQRYDVVRNLFRAFPEIKAIQDIKTSLLPFMLAAAGNWKNENDQINATYQLLREDPHSIFEIKR